ncbi:hypothetical protein DL769_000945 [Monosporascus sp. CRB-8-3]|nr:hypothetical protein DL769_000945 [Monosporascus sp. CRB-8-3]
MKSSGDRQTLGDSREALANVLSPYYTYSSPQDKIIMAVLASRTEMEPPIQRIYYSSSSPPSRRRQAPKDQAVAMAAAATTQPTTTRTSPPLLSYAAVGAIAGAATGAICILAALLWLLLRALEARRRAEARQLAGRLRSGAPRRELYPGEASRRGRVRPRGPRHQPANTMDNDNGGGADPRQGVLIRRHARVQRPPRKDVGPARAHGRECGRAGAGRQQRPRTPLPAAAARQRKRDGKRAPSRYRACRPAFPEGWIRERRRRRHRRLEQAAAAGAAVRGGEKDGEETGSNPGKYIPLESELREDRSIERLRAWILWAEGGPEGRAETRPLERRAAREAAAREDRARSIFEGIERARVRAGAYI